MGIGLWVGEWQPSVLFRRTTVEIKLVFEN